MRYTGNTLHPFGMITLGRNWEVGSEYRFGFNGKESDKETYGDGNIYDYGFRIYNPRIGKFLSVDPITSKYPMLTPYQFASNSPINGVDLDGLEWVHYKVYIDRNGKIIKKVIAEDFREYSAKKMGEIHGMDGELFYEKYSKGFGIEGKGVKYTYFVENDKGEFIEKVILWEVEDDWPGITRHGMYYGKGSVTKAGPFYEAGYLKYDFTVQPNDMTDALARLHDIGEDEPNYNSWKNVRYIYNDIDFVKGLDLFISGVENGTITIDPFTGRPVSEEAIVAARNARAFFKIEIDDKMHKMVWKYQEGKITWQEYLVFLKTVEEQWKKPISLPQPTTQPEKYTK